MLKYFPFTSSFEKMGTSAFPAENPLAEIDEHYYNEVMLKRKLLDDDHAYYYQASPVTINSQWEVVEKILKGLSSTYPENFKFKKKDI